MKSFEEKLVAAVIKKRDAEGLSIRALSTIVGVSFSSLARIERGDGQPDHNSKIRLLEWLGADAEEWGLAFERVAFVHFRAMKNIRSSTVQMLLDVADRTRLELGSGIQGKASTHNLLEHEVVALSKEELESIASKFRRELNLSDDDPLDPLLLEVESIRVLRASEAVFLDRKIVARLRGESSSEWSAMSVPLDADCETWSVLLNDCHTLERQRVTILEEFWHILLGHKLTKVARLADSYGRTYDKAEEHDAYFLASATLLPARAVTSAVAKGRSSVSVASQFGTSPELVDYRIKRLGLWREHIGKKIVLSTHSKPR